MHWNGEKMEKLIWKIHRSVHMEKKCIQTAIICIQAASLSYKQYRLVETHNFIHYTKENAMNDAKVCNFKWE